jgi:hypothetical protein
MRRGLAALAVLVELVVSCGGSDGGGSVADGGANGCTLGSTMAEIESRLFRGPKCSLCHTKATLYPTSLDLVSDGLAARVVDQPASTDPAKGKCMGRVLVPRSDPLGGLFVEKVRTAAPQSCGDRMPQNLPALTPAEISCVELWAMLAVKP